MWKNSLKKASTMNSMQNPNVIAAAVGATIGVVSVAAVFIYHKVMEKQQQAQMTNNLDRVNRKVHELQEELAELRNQQLSLQKSRRKRAVRKSTPPSNENTFTLTDDIDSYSMADTDVGDDEFFDCSDSEGELDLVENGTCAPEATELRKEESMFKQIDSDLDDRSLQLDQYPKLKTLLKADPTNVEVVWRFARVCYYCCERAPDKDSKREFIEEGTSACERILEVENGGLYKWYAILVGIKSGLLGTKEKIQTGYTFKKYVEKAIAILPRDSYLHHLLGRFKYEVSKLSWIERKVAATLFAEVPKCSYEEALKHFEQSESLGVRPFYENKLYLSKCCFALGRNDQGIDWLHKIIEPLEGSNDEQTVRNEAQLLLAKHS